VGAGGDLDIMETWTWVADVLPDAPIDAGRLLHVLRSFSFMPCLGLQYSIAGEVDTVLKCLFY
jgi:hypothetical protein